MCDGGRAQIVLVNPVSDVPVHIVVEGVVAAQCDQRAQAQTVGEEDLSCGIQPHLEHRTHNPPHITWDTSLTIVCIVSWCLTQHNTSLSQQTNQLLH